MTEFVCACGWKAVRGPIAALAARHKSKCPRASETSGPCVKAGAVLVDETKCPTLFKSLTRGLERFHDGWERVIELRRKGKGKRLARKLLGVKPKKAMPQSLKDRWAEKNKEE